MRGGRSPRPGRCGLGPGQEPASRLQRSLVHREGGLGPGGLFTSSGCGCGGVWRASVSVRTLQCDWVGAVGWTGGPHTCSSCCWAGRAPRGSDLALSCPAPGSSAPEHSAHAAGLGCRLHSAPNLSDLHVVRPKLPKPPTDPLGVAFGHPQSSPPQPAHGLQSCRPLRGSPKLPDFLQRNPLPPILGSPTKVMGPRAGGAGRERPVWLCPEDPFPPAWQDARGTCFRPQKCKCPMGSGSAHASCLAQSP